MNEVKGSVGSRMKIGILTQNPVLVLLLGMCPTLATSTELKSALGMGLCATVVLICSNTVVSALRKFIPDKIRIASFVVIIAGFVTMVDYLVQALSPTLSNSLGMYIPLIAVNCIILARAEAFASKNTVSMSIVDGFAMGAGFTFALSAVAFFRELLGNGSLLGFTIFPKAIPLFSQPAGGFITLGIIIAAVVAIRKSKVRV